MNCRSKIIAVALMLSVVSPLLFSQSIRFRSGVVHHAQISTSRPRIINANADAFAGELPTQPLYAAVTVELEKLRKISIFDYSLLAFGRPYMCIAIDTGRGFTYTTDAIANSGLIRLLFVLNRTQLSNDKLIQLQLKPNALPDNHTYTVQLWFENIGSSGFPPLSGIKRNSLSEPPKPAPAAEADGTESGSNGNEAAE